MRAIRARRSSAPSTPPSTAISTVEKRLSPFEIGFAAVLLSSFTGVPEDQGFLLDPGDVGREVPGFEVCAELPPGEADGGEGLVPIPGGPSGMEEVGGLRVVPVGLGSCSET